jgi:hypothetical protein
LLSARCADLGARLLRAARSAAFARAAAAAEVGSVATAAFDDAAASVAERTAFAGLTLSRRTATTIDGAAVLEQRAVGTGVANADGEAAISSTASNQHECGEERAREDREERCPMELQHG